MVSTAQPQPFAAPPFRPTLVRQFTDDLDGTTPLAAGVKIAQARIDIEIATRERLRTELLLRDLGDDNSSEPFREAELVRRALQTAAEDFFKNTENDSRKKESKLKIFRTSSKGGVESRVEQRMRQSDFQSLDDVKTLVGEMGDEWKGKHGKVYGYFTRICKTLNAHKDILKIVPNQNDYVQVLSVALCVVVQASAYHAEIAENLAIATAHICERVSVCSQLVQVIQNRSMHRQLASIYTSLFLFLLKVAKWFNKSATGRFFDSFNASVKQEHDEAVADINRSIDMIMEQGGVEELVRTEYIRRTVDIVEWKMDKYVVQGRMQNIWQSQQNLEQAGRLMLSQWEAILGKSLSSSRLEISDGSERHETLLKDVAMMTREETEMRCKILEALIHGTDGLELAEESQMHFTDMHVIIRITTWIKGVSPKSRKLWIEFPFEYQQDTVARATAAGVISIAAKANVPFISHICRKPNTADIPKSHSTEAAGIMSLVCSLILQLLRFRPENDGFRIDHKKLNGLSNDKERWKTVLEVLGLLLEYTPVVRYCIIHGMNEFESEENSDRCNEFLDLLFSRCIAKGSSLGVLLTTSGQSRVLAKLTDREERVRSDATMSEAMRRGQDMGTLQT
ncbi:hypothetical protein K504DRAFT_435598 [Pleomassaria siparia CBS 279.74]|uniref:DUF7708 domain-containing protein n=1 Tax=Pleomassaria siparia CBS 279.74 TaxID=1314801 RepID=A0A6G1K5P8_9PLEO|nr:hypothetical protein K504DRAFT_435598 [Pleomassaria siparia CBS 279.74]